LVDRHADVLISSPDANVRRWCARAMIAKQDVGRIQMLSSLLDDVNPSLRREVADGLVKLAELPSIRDEVLQRTTEILSGNAWRGCEQAVVVLTKLDHKPSGERMVELLGHKRGEVQVASAWGLTRLRVEKLLPGMLDHAQSVFEGFRASQLNDGMPGASLHLAHLFIAFGDQQYRESNSLLREYLPKKHMLGIESRAAAAWALGMLYEDDLQADLVPILLGRINDDSDINAETGEMKAMCAIALGRMKAESALPDLRKRVGMGLVGSASYWAIERMTGETPPLPVDVVGEFDDWFLMPIKDE
jgi:HEAT repeat protein